MTGRTQESEREEIEMLLPWYATRKLDAADHARVERYLESHPEMRRIAELANEEADATFAANEAIAVPRHAILDQLLAKIEAEPKQRATRMATGVWQRCVDWLDGFAPSTLALAGAAAALLVVVQAASIGALLLERQGSPGFQTATGPTAVSSKGSFALVTFVPSATVEAITTFLNENHAEIVEGPKAAGVYRVRLSPVVLDAPAAAAAIEKLKSRRDLVSFAAVIQ
jgi:hypothetical protein